MQFLRQNTVSTVKLGPFVSPTDAITPFTAGGFTVKVGANGGALAARHDTTAVAYDADGYFAVELDATDTAAVGRLKLEVPGLAGSYLPVWDDFTVLSQAVYDWLFGTAAPNTVAPLTTLGTTAPAGWLNTAAFATGATLPRVTLCDTVTTLTGNTPQTGDAFARIGAAGAGLTALGDARLANLDAAVSSRSTFAGGAVASVTGAVGSVAAPVTVGANNDKSGYSLNLSQTGYAPRDLSAVADSALTTGDLLVAAACGAVGKESVVGTTYTVKTPSTGTVVRAFTLDSGSAPTSRS